MQTDYQLHKQRIPIMMAERAMRDDEIDRMRVERDPCTSTVAFGPTLGVGIVWVVSRQKEKIMIWIIGVVIAAFVLIVVITAPPGVTEDELRAMGLSGEYYHARNTGTLDDFWRRFGPSIERDLPLIRGERS